VNAGGNCRKYSGVRSQNERTGENNRSQEYLNSTKDLEYGDIFETKLLLQEVSNLLESFFWVF